MAVVTIKFAPLEFAHAHLEEDLETTVDFQELQKALSRPGSRRVLADHLEGLARKCRIFSEPFPDTKAGPPA